MRNMWRTLRNTSRRGLVELVLIMLAALVVCVLGFATDFSGRVYFWFVALGAGRGEVGFVLGVLAVALAIFALLRWRHQRRAQALYRAIFENAPVGVFRATPDGRFLMANPALAHILGYDTPQELIASVTQISNQLNVSPDKRDAYQNALWREGVVRDFENQVYRKDGSTIWVLGNGRAVRDARRNILYIEGNLQDITARKQAEAAYQSLVEQSLQGFAILQAGRFVFCNSAHAALFGYSVSEILSLSREQTAALAHPEDRDAIQQRIQDRLQGKAVPSQSVFQAVRKDGAVRWLEASLSRTEYQGAPALQMITVDITERKHTQDKMQANILQARLREEVSASLARGGNDLRAVLKNLTHVLLGAMGDSCLVTLISADGLWSDVAAYAHVEPERAAVSAQFFSAARLPVHHPYLSRVLIHGEPLTVTDIGSEYLQALEIPEVAAYLKRYHVSSFIAVPMRNGGRILGALVVAREESNRTRTYNELDASNTSPQVSRAYTIDEQALLQELADRAALAIANAQLVQQLHIELDARREAEEKYRTLVEQIPAITYIASPERVGETIYVSPQIETALGFTPQEWTATPNFWVSRLHPDDRSWVLNHGEQSRHAHLPFRAEYRLLARDGAVHWIRDEARLVFDQANRPLYQHGIMVDITSYKKLEGQYAQTLQHADAKRAALERELTTLREFSFQSAQTPFETETDTALLRALVDNSVDTLVALALDGTILFINSFAEKQFDYAPDDLIGTNLVTYAHPDDAPSLQAQLRTLIEHPEQEQRLEEFRFRTRSQEWRVVKAVGIQHLDHPDLEALVFTLRDVTEQSKRERARRDAETAEDEQRAFADALRDVAALLNRAADADQVLDGVLDALARIVPYDTASVFMRDGKDLHMARARGFEKYDLLDWVTTITFPTDMQKFQQITRTAAPLVIDDTRTFEGWIPFAETLYIRSHLTAPIRIGGETVGMLNLDSATPNFYSEAQAARVMAFADLAAAALRNGALLRETQQRAQEFRALYETTRDLGAPIETAALLETIVARALDLLQAPIAYLFSYNAQEQTLRLVVNHGLDLPIDGTLRMGEGLAGQVALQNRPLFINDYEQWEYRIPSTAEQHVRAALAVPIAYGGSLIGVLGVAEWDARRQFDEKQLSLLMLFAGQVGAALETARLLSETRQRAEQLSLLYDVGLTLNRVLEERTQLEFLFKIAQRALHSDNIAYFQYDAEMETIVYELGVGVPREIEAQLVQQPLSVRDEEGAVGWVAKHRLPALIPEVNQDPRWQKLDRLAHSAVGVPVEHERELHGVLIAVRYKPEPFTPQDERMLILFANQVAAAMELTRLFQAQAQRQHELEILREASLAFAAANDRETLTTLILQFALRLVAANNAFLFFYRGDTLEFGGMLWSEASPMKPEHFAPRRDGLTYTVARTGEMIVIDEVNQHPMFATWRWGGAIVGLPLKQGGLVRGVMNVAYEEPHRFTSEELRALELLVDQAAVALENAHNHEETQAQLRDALLLHRAGEALNHMLSFQQTLERLADFFLEAFDVQVCSVSRLHLERDELEILLDRDPRPESVVAPGRIYRLSDHAYLRELLYDKKSCALRRDDPTLSPQDAATMDTYQWRSLLALPLFAGDQVIGFVELANHHECIDFSPQALRLAESLAHQAASALQNARLFQQTQRRAEELAVLNRIARRVNAAATLDELLDVIQNETAAILPSDASYIALYDAATEMVDFYRVIDFGALRPPFQWRLGPSFTRLVIATARAVRIDDRTNYPSADNPPQYYGDGSTLSSYLGVPIRSGERVLGVISIQAIQRTAFRDADEQLLQTIADQVAAALERALRANNV